MLYVNHKEALDLIYKHRFDRLESMLTELITLINGVASISLDTRYKQYVRFYPKAWDVPALQQANKGWTKSRLIVLFEFVNEPNELQLKLTLGPGPTEIRRRLFDLATRVQPPFGPASIQDTSYTSLWTETMVSASLYSEGSHDELSKALISSWDNFVGNSSNPSGLRLFTEAVCREFGI
jgi:hypothetical protein